MRSLREILDSSMSVMGINRRNRNWVLRLNPRRYFPLADDKLQTKRLLESAGVSVPPTITTFGSFFELSDLEHRLAGSDEFVVKPARGRAGQGILVVTGRNGSRFRLSGGSVIDLGQLRRHIADIVFGVYAFDKADVALVEKRIEPSGFFGQLCPEGLPDVRVVVVENKAVAAMIRIPTRRSGGRANIHQGAVGLGLDLASGRTTRAWHGRRYIDEHPDTGMRITGIEVPGFQALLSTALKAAKVVPLGYLGVDIVVDRDMGPLVMEVNARPGLEIQNVCGEGLRAILEGERKGR